MLTETELRLLAQVNRRTPMGELLRRYWHPIAAVAEIEERERKAVRLLGEELVLYRDKRGHYGLIDQWCPHARADMSLGTVEESGFRCNFHGWLFDEKGRCLATAREEAIDPSRAFENVIKGYTAEAKYGLVWAYLGPQPAPLIPAWEPLTRPGVPLVAISEINCPWFQFLENGIDPVHLEWLHYRWSRAVAAGERPPPSDTTLDEFAYGFVYRRMVPGSEAEATPASTRVVLWPNALVSDGQIEWRVPMDENRTLSIAWFLDPPARNGALPERKGYWYGPVRDPQSQRWINARPLSPEFLAWLGDEEHGPSTGSGHSLALLRRRFYEEARALSDTADARGAVRDPAPNESIELPGVVPGGFVAAK